MSHFNTADDEDFDPYHKWLGIPKDQRPPTHYQLLGISPNEEDEEAIEAAAERQKLFVKGFEKGPRSRTASSVLYQIEEAKVTLLNPTMRDAYDERLGIRRDYRRTYEGKSPGATDFGSGSNSVGESGGFLKDYAKFVVIFTTAFLAMAISAFYLPWSRLSGGRQNVEVEANRNNAQIPQANQQKPVEQKIEKPKQVANVAEKKNVKPPAEKKADIPWIDLIDESKVNKVRTHGDWKFSNGVLTLKGNPRFSAVHYPILLADNYELDLEFNRLGDFGTPLSLPIGHTRIRLVFYDDWIEISRVHNERTRHTGPLVENGKGIAITTNGVQVGRYQFEREEYGVGRFPDGKSIRIPNGTHMSANVHVTIDGKSAEIEVTLNGKPVLSWKGELKNLSECKEGDFYEGQSRQGLVVGTFQGGSNQFTRLRYRITDSGDSISKDEPQLATESSPEKSGTHPVKLPDTPHHKTALWILEQQGQLEATTLSTSGELGRVVTIYRKEHVPSQDFRVTKINFFQRPIEDSHIRRLSEQSIEDVVDLNLMKTKISDVGLQHVAKMKSLRSLNIAATKVDGSGFRYLTDLKYLGELLCGGAPIQDSSLRYLKDYPSISTLGLIDTKVTDGGMVDLSQITTLAELRLNGTKLTDRGLANLSVLKGLKILSVSNTKVSQNSINAFRKKNPACVVTR